MRSSSAQTQATAAALVGVAVFTVWWYLSRTRRRPVRAPGPRRLFIIHFNDVYDVNPRTVEPVGGAARFATLIRETNEEMCGRRAMVLFSGDALNPSPASQTTRGAHMVPVLNAMGVHAACLGNHDLDCGLERFEELRPMFDFPWLVCNVRDKSDNALESSSSSSNVLHQPSWDNIFARPKRRMSRRLSMHMESDWRIGERHSMLGGCGDHLLFDWPVDDDGTTVRVGVFGVVELEWLETLNIKVEELVVEDPVVASRRQVEILKSKGAEVIIALSHMRLPNDAKLAQQVPGLHLVLGGHDHSKVIKSYHTSQGHSCTVVKSGSDFKHLSCITVELGTTTNPLVTAEHLDCESELFEDPALKSIITELNAKLASAGHHVIGRSDVDLDGRFAALRTSETNLGNFLADVMRFSFEDADAAIINSGTIRIDQIIPRGEVTVGQLNSMLPIVDSLSLVQLSGAELLVALNNGVSKYPAHEGRFPQVSGISFEFDPTRPENDRVVRVFVGGAPLVFEKRYKVAVKEYMLRGKDGYDILKTAKVLVGPEVGPVLGTQVRNFLTLQKSAHRLSRSSAEQAAAIWMTFAGQSVGPGAISPQVENRIVCVRASTSGQD